MKCCYWVVGSGAVVSNAGDCIACWIVTGNVGTMVSMHGCKKYCWPSCNTYLLLLGSRIFGYVIIVVPLAVSCSTAETSLFHAADESPLIRLNRAIMTLDCEGVKDLAANYLWCPCLLFSFTSTATVFTSSGSTTSWCLFSLLFGWVLGTMMVVVQINDYYRECCFLSFFHVCNTIGTSSLHCVYRWKWVVMLVHKGLLLLLKVLSSSKSLSIDMLIECHVIKCLSHMLLL